MKTEFIQIESSAIASKQEKVISRVAKRGGQSIATKDDHN
jgi:hypothetical protein